MADGSVTIKAILEDGQLKSKLASIKTNLQGVGSAGRGMGSDVGAGMSDATGKAGAFDVALGNLAAQGIQMALGACKDLATQVVDIGMNFESSMSKVAALSGATGGDLEALEAKAREMGATTTFSASESADALGYMALAGWDTNQLMEGLPGVLTLAQAGCMDLASASDLVTDYLSAFGMEASDTQQMVDVLAYAQGNANTSTEQLGAAFKNCAANASAAGMDVETTTAAISMMSNQGLKGSEAGTALNAVMRDMTAQMEDGAIAIGDTSVAVMDSQGNYRDFCDILADVEAATDGMGEAEKASALQSTFTADSIKGLNLMLNAGAGEMSSFRDELYGSAGAAQEMADVMTDNLAGDLAEMRSAFEELALKVSDLSSGALRGLVQFVTGNVVPALEWIVQHAGQVGLVLGALGAAVVAFSWGSIIGYLGQIGTAVKALGAAIMANPVGIALVAVAAIIAALVYLYNTNEDVRAAIDSAWSAIRAKAEEVWAVIGPLIQQAMDAAAPVVQTALQAMGEAFTWLVVNVMPLVVQGFSIVCDAIIWAVGKFGEARDAISKAIGRIKSVIETLATIPGRVQGFFQSVYTAVKTKVDSAKNAVDTAISAVKSTFDTLSSLPGTVSAHFQQVVDGVKSKASAIEDAIRNTPKNIASFFENIPSTIVGYFRGLGGEITNAIGSIHMPKPHISWDSVKVGPTSISVPNIDWYATGGYFTGPTIVGLGDTPDTEWALRDRHLDDIAGRMAGVLQDAGGAADMEQVERLLRQILRSMPREFRIDCDRRQVARLVWEVQRG